MGPQVGYFHSAARGVGPGPGFLMRETLGAATIEDLPVPFAVVCCDLETGDEVALKQGSVADAVLASSAIPGILPPSVIDGRALVDGAMVTPVPVLCARSMVSEEVMAVNVLRPPSPEQSATPVVSRLIQGTAPAQLVQRVEEFLTRHLPRVAGAGQEISTRPFQLVTGRVWRGSAFGGVKGRSELPEYVERYLRGEFKLDDFITHTMGLEDINNSFDLLHKGESIRTVIHFDK